MDKTRLDMESEEQELDQAWAAAIDSPEYVNEMQEVEAAFQTADTESARMIQ